MREYRSVGSSLDTEGMLVVSTSSGTGPPPAIPTEELEAWEEVMVGSLLSDAGELE